MSVRVPLFADADVEVAVHSSSSSSAHLKAARRGFVDSSRDQWLCALANFVNAADRVILPVALPLLAKEFRYSLDAQGWIHSAFPAGYISSQIVGSCVSAQLPSRRLLLFVVFLWSVSTLLTPLSAEYLPLFFLARVALGIGEGLGMPTLYRVLTESTSVGGRSRAIGWLHGAGAIGQTLAAFFSPNFGWRTPFFACGSLGLLWCFLWLRYSEGLKEDIEVENKLLCHKVSSPLRKWGRFTQSPLLAIYFAHFAMNWSSYAVLHWLPTYLLYRFSANPKDMSLAAFPYITNSVAGVLAGYVVDNAIASRRISLRRARVLSTGVGLCMSGVCLLLFAVVPNLYVAIFFVSLAMGFLAINAAGHLSNHADVASKYAGITFAISNTIATMPGLVVGPLTAHLVIESTGRWWPSFCVTAFLNFTAAAVYANYAKVTHVV